jgi:anti-sigma factor RsiW
LLFDGELAPEEEAAVREGLEGSEHGAAELRAWGQLRTALQSTSSAWAGDLDSDALFARIEAEIGASAPSAEPSKPAVEPVMAPEAQPTALRAVPGRRERRVWAAVATGLAAAAAVALAVLSWPSGPPSPVRGSEVVKVDFGSNTGTVFEVEGGAGESLAVVWIDEEEVAIP